MAEKIQTIVIVGGGSAGWMTAAYLSRAFENKIRIKLVESSNITTIGVGEATFSTIKVFFDYLGLQEKDWMPQCNATYKIAIKFENWNSERQPFYHPFQRYDVVDGLNLGEWWLKLKRDQQQVDHACFVVPKICENQRSPRYLDGRVYDEKVQTLYSDEHIASRNVLSQHTAQLPYAYHFDANLLARFMKEYAKARGVEQLVDDVVEVKLTESGSIASLLTRASGEVSGDLFIDCTGFRGLLINKALNEPFIPFAESLFCDSAIALQIPTDVHSQELKPYTTATALSAGWVWNIPLYGRVGTGYVYASAFQSKDDAEQEFRRYLGPTSERCSANHIKMRIGRNRRSWVKNCVAIGLSSGFVEPLESTGIFFIQQGIEELVSHFPDRSFDDVLVRSYNRAIADCIDGVRDFLILHYYASTRADNAFWKATKKDLVLSDELRDRLETWRHELPNKKNINPKYHGFEAYSYSVMLLGLGYLPKRSLPVLDHLNKERALATFARVAQRADHLTATLPSQYEYLTHIMKSQDYTHHEYGTTEAGDAAP